MVRLLFIIALLSFNLIFSYHLSFKESRHRTNSVLLNHNNKYSFENDINNKLLELDNFTRVDIGDEYNDMISRIGNNNISFSCTAYRGQSYIKYLRTITITGEQYNVLNIMAVPHVHNNQLPILGIDLISLPGKQVPQLLALYVIFIRSISTHTVL